MGERPLYRGADIRSLPKGGNAGLWYDKFCHSWTRLSARDADFDKAKWVSDAAGRCGNADELRHRAERQRELIERLNGRCLDLQTAGPFVAGLGRAHPVENGFLWHHRLGVPYLPGSSVKGAVSTWAKRWKAECDADCYRILGSEERVGDVIFFDALPTKPVQTRVDVMTPHYGEYDRDGKPPGDWISPVPIPFLSVAEGAMFRFAVAPRRQSSEASRDTACRWLEDALEWLGAGARTAVGYGRFGKARPTPPREVKKGDEVEAVLFRDKKDRWCGRTGDGQEGTVFSSSLAPDDATVNEIRTLYVRVVRPLQFQWSKSVPKSPPRRSPEKFRRR